MITRVSQIFSKYFPFLIFDVSGRSMLPALFPRQKLLVVKFYPVKIGDIVVCIHPKSKKILTKRISRIEQTKYFVQGDNRLESQDSREFSWIEKKDIIGKVIYIF